MYIVQSIVTVPEEKAEEVIGLYQNRSRSVDRQPGFLSFQLLQNEAKPEELTVHMTWETKEAYVSWVTSEDFKRIHELEKKYPDQELANIKPTVRRFLVRAE
ncbi:antibiotic biosynthesis monooxygenase family protein [Paenibacillus aurantius]|uniref:Antibiotic biosynthesis monooxygenase family protein n=1 Tax=Paenibacillus aurantius TaxID=2918900 RepID=A0AA96LGH1_9BACL|nr:antibiotic biosynthesis monooxygenase family protein [Paenibacillus aurantius]WJH32438.1 antibiotic biosynthesis monooxygenase [Paenibacillus sp. CC-CFT747]WNQ12840.1 antibiotic biosynthesis monooxygenase family protein [Paenibacillus aurantius]